MTTEDLHERRVIVTGIIDESNLDPFGHLVGADGAGDGGHDMLAVFEKLVDEMSSN